jgi:hypothetical protein
MRAIELPTEDLTDLLEETCDIDIVLDLSVDDLDPPTEDIEDFLVPERRPSAEESQTRLRVRRSWIAMSASNGNASCPKAIEPTRVARGPSRAPQPSLPRFPLLPPPKANVLCLPSFPLLPPEPRRVVLKGPPVRLPRFSLHDGMPAVLPRRGR